MHFVCIPSVLFGAARQRAKHCACNASSNAAAMHCASNNVFAVHQTMPPQCTNDASNNPGAMQQTTHQPVREAKRPQCSCNASSKQCVRHRAKNRMQPIPRCRCPKQTTDNALVKEQCVKPRVRHCVKETSSNASNTALATQRVTNASRKLRTIEQTMRQTMQLDCTKQYRKNQSTASHSQPEPAMGMKLTL